MSTSLELIDREQAESILRDVVREEVQAALAPLLSLIVLQQKDAAPIADVSARTLSNKISKGDVSVLSKDGSRKNFLTLQTLTDLKVRKR